MKRNLGLLCLAITILVSFGPGQAVADGGVLVEGHVYLDINQDSQRQEQEPGIGGVMVAIQPLASDQILFILTTDPLGAYRIEDLAGGAYLLKAQPPEGYACASCQAEVDVTPGLTSTVDLTLAVGTSATPMPTDTPLPSPTPGNPIITFYASPDTTRHPGDCTTLFWAVDRATEVFLLLPSGQMGVEGSGQQEVCPQATTPYRLKVNSLHGSQEIIEALVVVPPPPTNTPPPTPRPPRPKPTLQPSPTATLTPAPTATSLPVATITPLPTATPVDDPLLSGLSVRRGEMAPAILSGDEQQRVSATPSPTPGRTPARHSLLFSLPSGYQVLEAIDGGLFFYPESKSSFLILYPTLGDAAEILSTLCEATTDVRQEEPSLIVEVGGRSFAGLFVETQSGNRLFLAATDGWALVAQGPTSSWPTLASGLNRVLRSLSFEEGS